MPRHLLKRLGLCSLVLGLILAAGIAAPSYAAGDPPPPPPIDWSDFIDGLGETPKDFVVGEEMCERRLPAKPPGEFTRRV